MDLYYRMGLVCCRAAPAPTPAPTPAPAPAPAPTPALVLASTPAPDPDDEFITNLINVVQPSAAPLAVTAQTPVPVPFDRELYECSRAEKDFSFEGETHIAKVVDIYDGDTVRLAFRFRGAIIQVKARMAGYDSPELKPRLSAPNRALEIEAARAAKSALEKQLGEARLVTAVCGPFDKYGRVLVTLFVGAGGGARGESLNAWMVASGHGRPYAGGTKEVFRPV